MIPWFQRRRVTPADLAPVAVPPAPKPAPGPTAAFTLPPMPTHATPTPRFQPGRHVVTYDRIGRHGARGSGLPAPAPLTAYVISVADLAELIRADVEPYLDGEHRIEVTVDMQISGGIVRAGALSGTFTFTRGGGAA